jgi:hypothetical protein
MWRRVALVRTNISEEGIAAIIRLTKTGVVGTRNMLLYLKRQISAERIVHRSSPAEQRQESCKRFHFLTVLGSRTDVM